MSLLDHIRRASPQAKSQLAFGISLLITLVIAGVWSTTLQVRFGQDRPEETAVLGSESHTSFSEVIGGALKDVTQHVGSALTALKTSEDEDGTLVQESEPITEVVKKETPSEVSLEEESALDTIGSFGTTSPETPSTVVLITATTTLSTSTTTKETVPSTTTPPRAPAVILIATTTSQTAE